MRILISLALLTVLSVFSTAQTSRPTSTVPSRTQSTSRGPTRQWEYLVVSFGKTYFSDPNSQPETKTTGLSKLLSYSRIGVVSATEALTIERQMDTLGKFGWELVGVVGAIGGDQQMVFRRPYDPEQSKAEAALIREEGERILAAQRQVASSAVQDDFVDLDEVERAAAIAKVRQEEEARLRSAITSLNNPAIVDVKVTSTAPSPEGSAVAADVTVDGSAQLLKDGNKYRTSEAESLAKSIALAIYQSAQLKREFGAEPTSSLSYTLGEVKISVSVRLAHLGKQKTVATATAGGKWFERR